MAYSNRHASNLRITRAPHCEERRKEGGFTLKRVQLSICLKNVTQNQKIKKTKRELRISLVPQHTPPAVFFSFPCPGFALTPDTPNLMNAKKKKLAKNQNLKSNTHTHPHIHTLEKKREKRDVLRSPFPRSLPLLSQGRPTKDAKRNVPFSQSRRGEGGGRAAADSTWGRGGRGS